MARAASAELKNQLRSSKDKISVRDETMKSRNALYFALFHRVKFVQVFYLTVTNRLFRLKHKPTNIEQSKYD